MKVLLDVNTPRRLRNFLIDHQVRTAQEQGWHTIDNGELLRIAETAGFDVMLTCDQNIAYQQNLGGRRIALIVLSTNDWSVLQHMGGLVAEAIAAAAPKTFRVVNVPSVGSRPG